MTLSNYVKHEKMEDVLHILRGVLEPTREQKGCLSYSLCRDIEDENTDVFIER